MPRGESPAYRISKLGALTPPLTDFCGLTRRVSEIAGPLHLHEPCLQPRHYSSLIDTSGSTAAPTHTSPCNPEPSALRPSRAFRGSGDHHLCMQVNHPPTEAPAARLDPRNQPLPICASRQTHPAVEAPRKGPRGTRGAGRRGVGSVGGRVSKKVSPNLVRPSLLAAAGSAGRPAQCRHPEHRETLPAPRDSPPDREGGARPRLGLQTGPQREGRSAGGARPRFPGKRPRL